MSLQKFYQNKKIFITGHTGFKGCWLALFLKHLGAEVTGYALKALDNSLFNKISLSNEINSIIGDIRNYKLLEESLNKNSPDIIFHLAAQPLVRDSYQDPITNYETNIIGTVNLLEAAKNLKSLKSLVNITTDKCYENKEWHWPYRENDQLGGYDPYSASKACSEIVTNSYRQSFYETNNIGLATARAGNVIGGGDFSKDRIIPDIVESIKQQQDVIIRSPNSIRPWQHVLDVLQGYMILGKKLYEEPQKFSEAFNFSPIENKEVNVETITQKFIKIMQQGNYKIDQNRATLHEAQILKLDSSKAIKQLGWIPKYDVNDAINNTAFWYKDFLDDSDLNTLCEQQLTKFINK